MRYMGWEKRSDETLVEIAQIGMSSGRISLKSPGDAKDFSLKEYLPRIDTVTPFPPRTVISQFQWTEYFSEVEIPFQNPISAQEREGVIRELWVAVRDNKVIYGLGSRVLFDEQNEPETLRYIAGGIDYALKPNSCMGCYPSLVVEDTRDLPSTLSGSFSKEMEAEFRKLTGVCSGISFDLEHCLGFLKRERE